MGDYLISVLLHGTGELSAVYNYYNIISAIKIVAFATIFQLFFRCPGQIYSSVRSSGQNNDE